MLVIVSKIGKQSRKYFRQQQKNLGVMNGNIEETVEGMKVIKVFSSSLASSTVENSSLDFRKSA